MMRKSAASDADEVMLDLEDAVAPDEKEAARDRIVEAIHEFDWSDTLVAVRINGLNHPDAYGDLITVVEGAGGAIDTVTLPKLERPEDVYVVDTLLDRIEAKAGVTTSIGIEVLIEEVEALQQVDGIAAASDRLEALIVGFADYAASQGVDFDDRTSYPGDIWHYVRNRTVVAARANGLDAIDGPYADISDPEGYRRECVRSRTLGFVGKWAIHPSQIGIANEVYAPNPEDVEHARRVVEAVEESQAEGRGVATLDGEMLDEASLRQARATLETARKIGMLD
jgi:citrate lyase subunit beta/citryl-CoA lyase